MHANCNDEETLVIVVVSVMPSHNTVVEECIWESVTCCLRLVLCNTYVLYL